MVTISFKPEEGLYLTLQHPILGLVGVDFREAVDEDKVTHQFGLCKFGFSI